MHQQEVARVLRLTNLLGDTRGHRHGGNARRADQRIDLAAGELAHQVAQQNAAGRTAAERKHAHRDDLEGLRLQEGLGLRRRADRHAQEDGDDVHQFVLRGLGEALRHAGFLEQVAQHQRTDQRRGARQHQGDQHGHDDREDDLLGLGDGAELTHDDLAILLAGQRLHNRRLDDRHQRHVGIRGDGDRAQQTRRELGGDVDGGRAVRAADDADCAGLSGGKAQNQRHDERQEDTQLRGSAEQQAHRVGDQRTEVGHRADAHEDERREDAQLNALIEVIQQAAVLLDILIAHQHIAVVNRDTGLAVVRRVGDDLVDRLVHNARQRQVRQQHAEGNRHQQQRLKLLDNGQIEQHERDEDHHRALPVALDDVVNTGIVDQTRDGAANAEVGHRLLHRAFGALRLLIHIDGNELVGIADQRHMAVADFGGFRLHGGSGLLGANGQRRKHAAQRQSEDHTQNFFHSA